MAADLALAAIRGLDSTSLATGGAAAASSTGAAQAGPTFAEALQQAAGSTVDSLRGAEQLSLKALTGDADIRDVSDAVMSAEQNLQAAIAIRDKIVTAFLEVSRMQI